MSFNLDSIPIFSLQDTALNNCIMCMDVDALKWCTQEHDLLGMLDSLNIQVRENDVRFRNLNNGCGEKSGEVCNQLFDDNLKEINKSWMPYNSQYLLCPYDYFSCNAQRRYVYNVNDKIKMGSNLIHPNSLCFYQIINHNKDVDEIKLYNFTISDETKVNVFTDDKETYFKYLGSPKLPNSELNFPFEYNSSIYIIASNTNETQETFYFTSEFIDNNPIGVGGIILIFMVLVILLFIIGCLISFISKKLGNKFDSSKDNPSLGYSGMEANFDTSYLNLTTSEESKQMRKFKYAKLNEDSKDIS